MVWAGGVKLSVVNFKAISLAEVTRKRVLSAERFKYQWPLNDQRLVDGKNPQIRLPRQRRRRKARRVWNLESQVKYVRLEE